jgi:hypothetical protein
MAHSFEELKKKRVAELREIASGLDHEAVHGYTQMNKEHLIKAVCAALGIDTREHHVAHISGKTRIKMKIKELKQKRDEAINAHNHEELKLIRRRIRHIKRSLHKATV